MKSAIAAFNNIILNSFRSYNNEEIEGNYLPVTFLLVILPFTIFRLILIVLKYKNNLNILLQPLVISLAGFLLLLIISILFIKMRKLPYLNFIIILSYSLFCFSPIFFVEKDFSAILWSISFPFATILFLNHKKGLYISTLAAVLLFWHLKDFAYELTFRFYGSYFLVLCLSMFLSKYINILKKQIKIKDLELSRLRANQLNHPGLYLEESNNEKFENSQICKNKDQKNIADIIRDIIKKKGEFYVFYRKDVLTTLHSVPQPDAVLSYMLLEGMSNINLFDYQNNKKDNQFFDMGNYVFTSCGVEDYFSKIDAVIELRSAKKRLEFNKIQTQINRVFSPGGEDETEESKLEHMLEQYSISEREADITRCILKGQTNKEISLELYISVETVKTHVKNILKKCGISSRIEMIKLLSNSRSDFL